MVALPSCFLREPSSRHGFILSSGARESGWQAVASLQACKRAMARDAENCIDAAASANAPGNRKLLSLTYFSRPDRVSTPAGLAKFEMTFSTISVGSKTYKLKGKVRQEGRGNTVGAARLDGHHRQVGRDHAGADHDRDHGRADPGELTAFDRRIGAHMRVSGSIADPQNRTPFIVAACTARWAAPTSWDAHRSVRA